MALRPVDFRPPPPSPIEQALAGAFGFGLQSLVALPFEKAQERRRQAQEIARLREAASLEEARQKRIEEYVQQLQTNAKVAFGELRPVETLTPEERARAHLAPGQRFAPRETVMPVPEAAQPFLSRIAPLIGVKAPDLSTTSAAEFTRDVLPTANLAVQAEDVAERVRTRVQGQKMEALDAFLRATQRVPAGRFFYKTDTGAYRPATQDETLGFLSKAELAGVKALTSYMPPDLAKSVGEALETATTVDPTRLVPVEQVGGPEFIRNYNAVRSGVTSQDATIVSTIAQTVGPFLGLRDPKSGAFLNPRDADDLKRSLAVFAQDQDAAMAAAVFAHFASNADAYNQLKAKYGQDLLTHRGEVYLARIYRNAGDQQLPAGVTEAEVLQGGGTIDLLTGTPNATTTQATTSAPRQAGRAEFRKAMGLPPEDNPSVFFTPKPRAPQVPGTPRLVAPAYLQPELKRYEPKVQTLITDFYQQFRSANGDTESVRQRVFAGLQTPEEAARRLIAVGRTPDDSVVQQLRSPDREVRDATLRRIRSSYEQAFKVARDLYQEYEK
jgi:hypothetical protein